MTCRDFADLLAHHADDALAAGAQQRCDDHMAICADCVQYLRHYTETVAACRLAVADEPAADVPEDLVRAILRARDAGRS